MLKTIKMNGRKKLKGFTLIELLVVIAIISILSSIVYANLQGVRAKARDVVRVSDLRQMRIALALYKEATGVYPPNSPTAGSGASAVVYSYMSSGWNILNILGPVSQGGYGFLPKIPKDPTGWTSAAWIISELWPLYDSSPNQYYYYYHHNPNFSDDYDLIARLETDHPLRCEERQWVTHNAPYIGAGIGSSWCPSQGTTYDDLIADH